MNTIVSIIFIAVLILIGYAVGQLMANHHAEKMDMNKADKEVCHVHCDTINLTPKEFGRIILRTGIWSRNRLKNKLCKH